MPGRRARRPARPDRDRGAAGALELVIAVPVMVAMTLAILQAAVWWHVRNLVEQAAEEGVRSAAAFDGSCAQGSARAAALAEDVGRSWVGPARVRCGGTAEVRLSVEAEALSMLPPFELTVRASAAAPKER